MKNKLILKNIIDKTHIVTNTVNVIHWIKKYIRYFIFDRNNFIQKKTERDILRNTLVLAEI